MLFKNVLSIGAALIVGSPASAQQARPVMSLIQKSMLTQHCLEGRFDGESNANEVLNGVLDSKISGNSGMSTPQGSLVVSDGRGKYALVEMGSSAAFSRENLKKGEDPSTSRNGQVSQVTYSVMMVEQLTALNTELHVIDYLTGFNGGPIVQFCRVGKVRATDIKDQKANFITNIVNHREIFQFTKTQKSAEEVLEEVSKSGKSKLNARELSVVKELLFGKLLSEAKTDAAKLANALYEYASDIRSDEIAKAEGQVRQVAIRDEDVKKVNLNLAAMQLAVLKTGFEVIGKKQMFIGENDLIGEAQEGAKYRASGARTHSILRLVRDPRALDVLIVK